MNAVPDMNKEVRAKSKWTERDSQARWQKDYVEESILESSLPAGSSEPDMNKEVRAKSKWTERDSQARWQKVSVEESILESPLFAGVPEPDLSEEKKAESIPAKEDFQDQEKKVSVEASVPESPLFAGVPEPDLSEEKKAESIPEEKKAESIPEEKKAESIPEEKKAESIPAKEDFQDQEKKVSVEASVPESPLFAGVPEPDLSEEKKAESIPAEEDSLDQEKEDEEDILENVISTGSLDIDQKIKGGILPGSLSLVEGPNDSGKSVMVQQILSGILNQNKLKILTFTTEYTVKSLLQQMQSLDIDISDYFIIGHLKIFPINEKITKTSANKVKRLLQIMRKVMASCKEDIIIIDSFTAFAAHSTEHDILSFFTECKKLCDGGKTIFITVHSHAFSEMLMMRVKFICDTNLHMEVDQVGEELVMTMEVLKTRGARMITNNTISFDVSDGLRIIPVSKTKI